ncbi:hypothetical protein I215_12233 [Galbibacter marinus]|uniref:Ig-like domain-containing protein n=1 Tax=Galbibacter marinus TaxID=555500 RepID=K2P0B9_9FLAO|nr:hypothetical protein [Galbibacter marinus]EKF54503.1 hypothetical protein I215_12233 [Galbibacter marinus]
MKSVCLALIIVSIFAVSIQTTYSQRVYANFEEDSYTILLANVINPSFASDPDLTNYSRLQVNVGLIGSIGTARQNLQFTGTLKPEPTAPIMIRFRYGGALLGLSNVFNVQRTDGGLNQTEGDIYTGSTLLGLLGLDEAEDSGEVIVPIPATSVPTDGVQIRLSALIGIGPFAELFYAFFITPPTVEFTTVYVCQGESALISISNFQSGYTYRVYDALTEGNLIYSGTTDVLSIPEEDLTTGTYYLEAVEGGTAFTSSRTAFDIVIYPKPGYPEIDLNVNEN